MKRKADEMTKMKTAALAGVDESMMARTMYLMSMLSDAQAAMSFGDIETANEILNHAKIIIDERIATKDTEGRHINPKSEAK